jgi:voltage-gated sodium channel
LAARAKPATSRAARDPRLAMNTSALIKFLESPGFNRFIIGVILANAVTLGLEAVPEIYAQYGPILKAIDRTFLAVFVVELVLKLIAYRGRFFGSAWNWFDALIVAVSLAPNAGPWSVLRALRLFRLFSAVAAMRSVVEALLKALPGMGAIVAVLGVVFYVAAIVATQLFGRDPVLSERFGSIFDSAYTLFRVMTLDGWTEVSDEVMARFPLAWLFFLPFIVLTSFAVLNLFIAVIVEALGKQKEAESAAHPPASQADMQALTVEVQKLRGEIEALRSERR